MAAPESRVGGATGADTTAADDGDNDDGSGTAVPSCRKRRRLSPLSPKKQAAAPLPAWSCIVSCQVIFRCARPMIEGLLITHSRPGGSASSLSVLVCECPLCVAHGEKHKLSQSVVKMYHQKFTFDHLMHID